MWELVQLLPLHINYFVINSYPLLQAMGLFYEKSFALISNFLAQNIKWKALLKCALEAVQQEYRQE
jgi:hypothetical protein